MEFKKGDKIALVSCSNGQSKERKEKYDQLTSTIEQIGLVPVWSEYIYQKETVFSGTAQERAESLMNFYKGDEIKAIFDIAGGDMANELLPYINFDEIASKNKLFWGYSDLTVIINAIYTKTNKPSPLYQICNLVSQDRENQIKNFSNAVFDHGQDLFQFKYTFIQKNEMRGIVVGGNIRCFLKLAGTEYWPDMTGKILLLESWSGSVPQMVSFLNQYQQLKVFEKVSGILLGTFIQMENDNCLPKITDLVKRYAGENVPIAVTPEIGHKATSKAILIGKELYLH